MCFKKKWTEFTPTKKYLDTVEPLITVFELYQFIQNFQWTGEKGDHWQDPEEFLRNFELDCDDFMRFTIDVLKRIMGIDAKGIISSGYDKERWGNKIWNVKCHAICVFPYEGKLAVFSNMELYTDIDSYEEAGYITFPDGLKSQIVYDWQGNVLNRRFKAIGTF